MIFKSLKDKCNYYRDLTDYRLLPNTPILVMIDGKNFSKLVKNKFEKPFDDWFIQTMNKTAEHLCKNVQNCIGAYVQSDEISLIIKDNSLTCSPFDGRICKLQSIIPAMATAFFNKELIKYHMSKMYYGNPEFVEVNDMNKYLDSMPDYVFDCKVWNVPNDNDAMAWMLYRQIDCIRNSKQQFCQTYVSHKELSNKDTDEQVAICLEKTGNDWNAITDDKKYGRLIFKEKEIRVNPEGVEYERSVWNITSHQLTTPEFREWICSRWFKDEKE